MIFVVKVMMFFVSIGLLCAGLFGLYGFKGRVGGVIASVAGIRALCPFLLLMAWRREDLGCYC